MSDPKKNTQRIVEMSKFLNVCLTAEQIDSVEKMLAIGVSPANIVRFIRDLTPATQSSNNRENGL